MRSRDDGERERIAARVRELLALGTDGPLAPAQLPEHRGPLVWRESDELEFDPALDHDPDPGPDLDTDADSDGDARAGGRTTHRWGPARGGRRFRADPGRRGVLAIAVTALLAAILTFLWVRASSAHSSALEPASTAGSPVAAGPPSTAGPVPRSPVGSACAAPGSVVVDVAGKVHRPGVYTLPTSARVVDAIRAAGGPLPGVSVTTLNLAAHLSDGQQVSVGVTPAVPVGSAPASTGPTGGTMAGGPLNLNSAGLEQLEALPGVGPVLAQNILDWRTEHGRFTSVEQLQQVTGIGDAKYATLRPLVTV